MDDERHDPTPAKAGGPGWRGVLRRASALAALTVLLVGAPQGEHTTGVRVASVTPADLGAVLLVGLVGLSVLAGRDLALLRDRLVLCAVGVPVAAIVGTWWSTDPMLSLVAVSRYAEIFCLVPLAVTMVLRDRIDAVVVLASVVALGVIEGAIGVYQSVTGTGAGYDGQTIRAIGTFGVSDVLGMATVVSVAMVVLLAVALRGSGRWRLRAVAGMAVLLVPLLLSLSRGALLSTLVAAAVMMLTTGVLRAVKVGVVLAAVVVLGLTATGDLDATVSHRIASIGSSTGQPDRSVQDRYDLWQTALSIWHVDPITGVGIKQFPVYRDSHAPLDLSSGSELVTTTSYARGELLSPHNEYLLLLSEQGVLGLGAYLVLLVVLGARLADVLRRRPGGTGQGRPGRRPRDGVEDTLRLAAVGIAVWYVVNLVYGDLAGSTAVLYSVLLGVQIRSAMTGRVPLATPEGETDSGEDDTERSTGDDVHQRVG